MLHSSANILLDKHFEAKISDFGLAEYANAGQTTGMFTHVSKKDMKQKVYKTRAYLPPEFFSNGPSIKSDTYGFGVVSMVIKNACNWLLILYMTPIIKFYVFLSHQSLCTLISSVCYAEI